MVNRAGAAGLLARLHHRSRGSRAGGIIAQKQGMEGAFSITGLQLCRERLKCGHDVCEHRPAGDRQGKGPLTADIVADACSKTADADVCAEWRSGGGVRTTCRAGRGQLWRISSSCCRITGGNTSAILTASHTNCRRQRARIRTLTGLITTFSANDPQELVTIDREKAKAMGVSLTQIATTLNVFMGRSTWTTSTTTTAPTACLYRPTRRSA